MRVKTMQLINAVLPTILLLTCIPAHANSIKTSLSATSLFSDNSLKKSEDELAERQDLYRLGVTGDYSNWLVEAGANYQLVEQRYDKNSQTDERYSDGESSILIGKQEDPLGLELSHSRRMLLTTPDAIDLISNQQEREVIEARPEVRIRLFDADRLSLGGQFARVSFPENDLQDSRRDGFFLGWLHSLSAVSYLQISAQQQKISFEQFPLADYSFSGSMLAYAVALRKLNYRLEFGYNRSEPEIGESQGEPSYKLSVLYQSGYNQFDFTASRTLTDSSFGNGNTENAAGLPSSDGSALAIDRMDRTSAELRWQTEALCMRCTLSAGISAVEDDYIEKIEKSLSLYGRTQFSYALSTAAKLSLAFARSDVDFDSELIARDYKQTNMLLEYAYQFISGINVRFAAENEERKASIAAGDGIYEENIYSIGLGYNF